MAKRRGHGEGSISKRSDGRWEGRVDRGWHDGRRRRKSVYGKTRSEVAQKLTAEFVARAQGFPTFDEREPLGAWLDRWLTQIAEPRVRTSTYRSYESIVRRHLKPTLGDIHLTKLSPQHVLHFMRTKREEGLSPRSIQYQHAVLRMALSDAERLGLVARNVARLVKAPSPDPPEVEPLSPDAAKDVLAAVRGHRFAPIVELALVLGLRQSEILGLSWSDISFEAGSVTVRQTLHRDSNSEWGFRLDRPKTRRSRRTIAAPDATMLSLRRHRTRQAEDRLRAGALWENDRRQLVFTDESGRPIGGDSASQWFRASLSRAVLPPMRFHDLRHGAASLMLANGEQPRVIMERLGHSQISTTMDLYSHVLPALDREAADRMGETLYATPRRTT